MLPVCVYCYDNKFMEIDVKNTYKNITKVKKSILAIDSFGALDTSDEK